MGGRRARAARVARGMGRCAVTALSAGVLALTGYGWSLTGGLGDRIVTSDVLPGGPTGPDTAFTALLVGLDSRTDAAGRPLPPAVLDALHAGDDEGQLNTDTIILLHVPRGPRPRAVAISFPRDSYVEIAGHGGIHKINSVYQRAFAEAERALSGRGLPAAELDRRGREAGRRALVATVQDLAGVTVDRFAEVNLAGFVEITDTLGGVPVCLKAPVREARSGIDLPAGQQVVRGREALAFVRQRRGLDGGDLDRIGRQQAFLAGLTSTVTVSGVLRDPARLDRVTDTLARYVVLDRGWAVGDLAGQLERVAAGDLTFVTIPTSDPALRTRSDGIAVEVDPDEVRRFVGEQLPGVPRSAASTTTRPSTTTPTTRRAPVATDLATSPSTTSADRRSTVAGRSTVEPTTRSSATTATALPITADGVPCVD